MVEDLELTILSKEQVFGDHALQVIKKYGSQAALTDLAIVTGAYVGDTYYHIKWDDTRKGRAGKQWTTTADGYGNVLTIDEIGYPYSLLRYIGEGSIRPVIDSSSYFNALYPYKKELYEGIYFCECGEYPQMAALSYLQTCLENLYLQSKLVPTGKKYTFNSLISKQSIERFHENICVEYEYEGEKYIRIKANFQETSFQKLSNKVRYKKGEYVWIKVEPVRWLLDESSKLLISEKCLVSGIEYQSDLTQQYIGNFEGASLNRYMNQYMKQELLSNVPFIEPEENFIKIKRYGK